MKFWFVHSGDVSLEDQIVTQVSLGILSGDLSRGERLPSMKSLSERFHIHPSIVSAAYRKLEREGWVEFRRGNGVHVRESPPREIVGIRPALHLDRLIGNLIVAAKAAGIRPEELRARILGQLDAAPPARLLLVDSDVELRKIVLTELQATMNLPPGFTIGCADLPREGDAKGIAALTAQLPGALVLVLPSKAEALRAVLPPSVPMQILRVRSIPKLLAPWMPSPGYSLVGVASRWPPFLSFAKIMLVAAGFDAESLLLRDASQYGWMSGMNQARVVLCDCLTAKALPTSIPRMTFNLLAEESVADLQKMVLATAA
jgi:GntR family transcriptional regulator